MNRTEPRPEIARMPKRNSGYYGLRRYLIVRGAPSWVWRAYWWLQPVRCLFGWHDWYSTAAGLCSGCRCGAGGPWPTWIAHQYRWTPWLREWAARVEDAQYGWEFWQREYFAALEDRTKDSQ